MSVFIKSYETIIMIYKSNAKTINQLVYVGCSFGPENAFKD
jgi:hypothetical protein